MTKIINVLVFPAGEVNSVELHDALATCVNIKLFGASSIDRHGAFIFKNYISDLPTINDNNFIREFNKLITNKKIDVIFPTHDTVAEFLVNNQDKIKAKVIAGSKQTTNICRHKRKTYQLFKDYSFAPKIYSPKTVKKFPVFAKPDVGQGSVGAKLINNADELAAINDQDYVITEYLPGDELTVDCFTDRHGKLLIVSPRSRARLLAGISVGGHTVKPTREIMKIAETINQKLELKGLWFFQLKKDSKNKYKLMEISTRAAGNMGLTRATGANLALLSVYTFMGYDVEPIVNSYNVLVDRTLINRYKTDLNYQTVYFDFDDTLIVDNQVHLYSIMFLYQCKNKGKKTVLLTRHEKDIHQTLKHYSIDPAIFNEIIHINFEQDKLSNINPKQAIFIDNSYNERKLVKEKFNIPVFDVDAIEVLLDWRT